MTKLWHSGQILSAAGLLAGLGNYGFQAIMGHCLDKAEFGYVNSTLGFIGLLGLPLVIVSTSITHYIAHFRATGDEARLQGLLLGCRKFLFRLTLAGSVAAALLIKPLSSFFHFPRQGLMLVALVCALGGLWGAFVSTLCQGLGWFGRLASITLVMMVLRLSFGTVMVIKYPVAEAGVLATGVALLGYLMWLRWRKELARKSEAVSPWNLEFAQYLAVGAAWAIGGYCLTQGDLLVAQRNFTGRDLGLYTAAGLLGRALPMVVAPMLTVLFTSRSGHRTDSALREQLKLLGLYAAGLAAGAAVLLVARGDLRTRAGHPARLWFRRRPAHRQRHPLRALLLHPDHQPLARLRIYLSRRSRPAHRQPAQRGRGRPTPLRRHQGFQLRSQGTGSGRARIL